MATAVTATSSVPTASEIVPGGISALASKLRSMESVAVDVESIVERIRFAESSITREVRDLQASNRLFVGYIREYRYTAGRPGEMPTHRCYVECDRGLWLYACVPSEKFEPMMVDMSIELTPDAINGRMVLCQPDDSINAIVPIRVVEELPGAFDRLRNRLYRYAPVLGSNDAGLRIGVVTEANTSSVRVALDEREVADDRVRYEIGQITRLF